jgi:hypothetical protein
MNPGGLQMKNLILTFAMVLVGGTAQASMVESYRSNLTTFQFQKNTALGLEMEKSVVSGMISVTPISDITLSIYHQYKCEMGQMCPAIAYAPITYQVPVKSVKIGGCKERIYSGSTDLRLKDGSYTKIVVVDNRTNICESFVAIPATQVTLFTTQGVEGAIERHTMTGESMIDPM